MSDKAQIAALGAHMAQYQPLNAVYKAHGRLYAACEVEAVTIGAKIYTAAELAEMAAAHEGLQAPLTAAETAEADAAMLRLTARRRLVQAAFRVARAEQAGRGLRGNTSGLIEVLQEHGRALDALLEAADAFLAAGGSEVVG